MGDCDIDLRLLEVDANHGDGNNTIVGDKGVQPFSRQRAGVALGHDFYRDANTILPNNLCEDEFLASIAVVAFLTFKDVINSNRLFFLHAFT